jgi:FkbM family methyltransferase
MLEKKFKPLTDFFFAQNHRSHSQFNQDLFVIFFTNFIGKIGYFVEIGAGDGKNLSNTLLLESLGWKGILVDPVDYVNGNMLKRNSIKDKRCVYSESGLKLKFKEQSKLYDEAAELNPKGFSGLFDHLSDYSKNLKGGHSYEVITVSLNDLLDQYSSPNKIDYISIDVEGSEFEILRTFDFAKYDVEIFTVEHNNFASHRESINELLLSQNYYCIHHELFKTSFLDWHIVPGYEDWYIKKDNPVLKKLGI